jgi:hypothetical protein
MVYNSGMYAFKKRMYYKMEQETHLSIHDEDFTARTFLQLSRNIEITRTELCIYVRD